MVIVENIAIGVALVLAVVVVLAFEFSGNRFIVHGRSEPLDLTRNGGIADHPAGMTVPRDPGPTATD
jgi:hypothetical protein